MIAPKSLLLFLGVAGLALAVPAPEVCYRDRLIH